MKRITFLLLIVVGIAAFSTAQTSGSDSFRQEGIASWYGGEFDGKPTASGEIFNSDLYTAAHPTLPFGTVLTVTNKQNNSRVTVRINDRGPFVAARIIDLSRAAAEVLDMLTTGTAPVIVEQAVNTALGPAGEAPPFTPTLVVPAPLGPVATTELFQAVPQPAPQFAPAPAPVMPPMAQAPRAPVEIQPPPPPPPAIVPPPPQPQPAPAPVMPPMTQAPRAPAEIQPPPPQFAPAPAPAARATVYPAPPADIKGSIPPAGSTRLYRLQVGAYKVPRNATEAFDKLKNSGLNPAYEKYGDFYRVVLPGLRAAEIQSVAQKLGNAGFREALIREE